MVKKAITPVGINIGVSFPGELLLVELVRLARDLVAGQPADVRAAMGRWFIEDIERHRKFWGLGADADFKSLGEILAGVIPDNGGETP